MLGGAAEYGVEYAEFGEGRPGDATPQRPGAVMPPTVAPSSAMTGAASAPGSSAAAGEEAGGPDAGTGGFTEAGAGRRVGNGALLVRFQVAVEVVETNGAPPPVHPGEFATAIERTLADRRGWAASGVWSFQRVRERPDVVIRLTTPRTTDERCAGYGLRTEGEVSCRGGQEIMINLRRWLLAVPWYADSRGDYRHMVINHEMGHFLGFDHATCPIPGETAAVMQAQTYGLDGCVRNPWPYPDGRSYLG